MSVDDLITAIRATDIGPFREIRLITYVHHHGVTPEVLSRVIEELKDVNEQEKREVDGLKTFLDEIEPEVSTIKELKTVTQKAVRQLAKK